jgi:hypothetical protein
MSEKTQYDKPGDDDLVSDDKLFRHTLLRMHREQQEDQKLIRDQVWGDIHATPPTNGLLRDVSDLKRWHTDKEDQDKWFKRVVVTAIGSLGLAGLSAWVASHWH